MQEQTPFTFTFTTTCFTNKGAPPTRAKCTYNTISVRRKHYTSLHLLSIYILFESSYCTHSIFINGIKEICGRLEIPLTIQMGKRKESHREKWPAHSKDGRRRNEDWWRRKTGRESARGSNLIKVLADRHHCRSYTHYINRLSFTQPTHSNPVDCIN